MLMLIYSMKSFLAFTLLLQLLDSKAVFIET